jgi:hypothetical protein
MSTPDTLMSFAQSQLYGMHFKNQQVLILREKAISLEIKAFAVRRRADPGAECQESHPPDTDSRLLTEMNRSRICVGRFIAGNS